MFVYRLMNPQAFSPASRETAVNTGLALAEPRPVYAKGSGEAGPGDWSEVPAGFVRGACRTGQRCLQEDWSEVSAGLVRGACVLPPGLPGVALSAWGAAG